MKKGVSLTSRLVSRLIPAAKMISALGESVVQLLASVPPLYTKRAKVNSLLGRLCSDMPSSSEARLIGELPLPRRRRARRSPTCARAAKTRKKVEAAHKLRKLLRILPSLSPTRG